MTKAIAIQRNLFIAIPENRIHLACQQKYATLMAHRPRYDFVRESNLSISPGCHSIPRDSALDPISVRRHFFFPPVASPPASFAAAAVRKPSQPYHSSLLEGAVPTLGLLLPHDGRLCFLRPLELGAGLRVLLLLGQICQCIRQLFNCRTQQCSYFKASFRQQIVTDVADLSWVW